MFHPVGHPLERGWVGRVEDDRVIHLAAQTLQSFFTGGGTAREHAEYRLDDVRLLSPVLHPPSVRLFEDHTTFAFANPAAVKGPGGVVHGPRKALTALPRVAAVIGAEGAIGGFTVLAEWRAEGAEWFYSHAYGFTGWVCYDCPAWPTPPRFPSHSWRRH